LKVVALAGGVGGAKLAEGLARILEPIDLTIIVNTGDDFRFSGLAISPDLDTVCYTLAGMSNQVTGWGLKDESWNTLAQLKKLGAPAWFSLGDKDLATHIERSRLLDNGLPLSEITRIFCEKWGVQHTIIPMTDDKVSTKIYDSTGRKLDFQEYFVKYHWEPKVIKIEFEGIEQAKPAPGVLESIMASNLVVICPSNPYVSIDPILKLVGIQQLLYEKQVLAVSPIIGGQAVKGPLAKMIKELNGRDASADFAAKYYHAESILNGYILDIVDMKLNREIERWGIICKAVETMMLSTRDRVRLAEDVLSLGRQMLKEEN
jgi:LPPG:FO 2-phospho-L-lactate transferase